MRPDRRLEALEASTKRAPTGDPESYCLRCLGPGGYRRMIDRARQRLASEEQGGGGAVCSSCGGLSFAGAILAERAAVGLP